MRDRHAPEVPTVIKALVIALLGVCLACADPYLLPGVPAWPFQLALIGLSVALLLVVFIRVMEAL